MANAILANSAGWNPTPPTRTQMLAPLMLAPRPGTSGSRTSTRPAIIAVYVYRRSVRWSRSRTMTAAARTTEIAVHTSWRCANVSSRPRAAYAKSIR